jgi:hypothetical protein
MRRDLARIYRSNALELMPQIGRPDALIPGNLRGQGFVVSLGANEGTVMNPSEQKPGQQGGQQNPGQGGQQGGGGQQKPGQQGGQQNPGQGGQHGGGGQQKPGQQSGQR